MRKWEPAILRERGRDRPGSPKHSLSDRLRKVLKKGWVGFFNAGQEPGWGSQPGSPGDKNPSSVSEDHKLQEGKTGT